MADKWTLPGMLPLATLPTVAGTDCVQHLQQLRKVGLITSISKRRKLRLSGQLGALPEDTGL